MACPRCGSDRPSLRLSSDNGRTHCGHGWHHYCNATDCERCNETTRPEDIVARELRRDGISADLAYGDAHDILAALAAAGFVVRPLPDEEQRREVERLFTAIEVAEIAEVFDCWTPVTYDAHGDGTPVERECGECAPCQFAAVWDDVEDGLAAAFLTEGPSE